MFCSKCGHKLDYDRHRFCPNCGNKVQPDQSHPTESYSEDPSPQIDPELDRIVDAKVVAIIGKGGYLGYCHRFWKAKKHILRVEYGIDWKTPAELNPDIIYD